MAQSATPRAKSDIKGFGYSVDLADIEPRAVEDMPPCFFVAGAPRCGTTAISKALSRNPRISFSKPKETHFLLDPPAGLSGDELRGLYLMRYHSELSGVHQAVGDGSVSYLYTPEALERALGFDPRARFVVMVRDPVAMLESYHARLLFMLDEDVTDFATAWALQERRAQGLDIPRRCRDPRLLMYGEAARHGAHVQRLYELAGRERCMVIVFDDWASDPRAVYQRVLAFLGVDDDGLTDFSSKRESAGFRSTFLQSIVMNPPRWLLRVVELSDTKRLEKLKALRKRIKRFNKKAKPRPRLSEEMRAVVRAHFADDVELLSSLLGRDLRHWR
ncbi:MAG: sulfotransferase [Chromatiales bacterium]|jgi:hypothetical protein